MLNAPANEAVDVEAEFRRLAEWWNRETGVLSDLGKAYQHPAYQDIISLGTPVVPILLRELEQRPDWWFSALCEITGIDPVPKDHRGRIKKMAADWLAWGRENGYVW